MDEPMPKTLFNAEVLKAYKDNENNISKKEIQVLQDGNSKWIFNDHIMPQPGDKFFLVLKKAVNMSNTYWVLTGQNVGYGLIDIDGIEHIYRVNAPEYDPDGVLINADITNMKKDAAKMIFEEKFKDKNIRSFTLFDKAIFIDKVNEILKKVE